MKLTCPKCQAQSTVHDERIPANGAWARCPRCQDRFFIKPPARQPDLFRSTSNKPGPAPARGRSPEAQKLIDRLRPKKESEAETSLDGPAGLDVITVFPAPIVPYAEFAMLLGLLAVVAVLVIIRAFWVSGEKAVITVSSPQAVGQVSAYDEEQMIKDLTAMRRNMFHKGSVFYTVDYTGLESRIFNYLMRTMAPGVCPGISRLEIRALRPRDGYTVIGTCLDARWGKQEIAVRWVDRSAAVSIPDRATEKMYLLFPPSIGSASVQMEEAAPENGASPSE